MRALHLIILILIAQSISIHAQQNPFYYDASYTGDVVSNLDGGIKTGTNALGKMNIGLGFDTEKAKFWNGGEFYTNFMNTHGDTPSADLIGDLHVASNIEAGNLSVLYEFWYKQTFHKFTITGGLQDLNTNYAVTENGGLFLNSSFGIHTIASEDIHLAIFPITALAIDIEWELSNKSEWRIALFDGTPNSKNAYNTNWIIGKEDGYLLISEFQLKRSLIKGKKGSYIFGGCFHQHNATDMPYHQYTGLYLIADQNITNKLSTFTQISFSPQNISNHKHFYSLGVNYKEFSKKRTNDIMGIAIAYLGIDNNNNIKHETAVELTYKAQLNNHLYLQPDIQYIINPAGTNTRLDNTLVGMIRLGLEF